MPAEMLQNGIRLYTVSQKTRHQTLDIFAKMLTNIQNAFTATVSKKFAKRLVTDPTAP